MLMMQRKKSRALAIPCLAWSEWNINNNAAEVRWANEGNGAPEERATKWHASAANETSSLGCESFSWLDLVSLYDVYCSCSMLFFCAVFEFELNSAARRAWRWLRWFGRCIESETGLHNLRLDCRHGQAKRSATTNSMLLFGHVALAICVRITLHARVSTRTRLHVMTDGDGSAKSRAEEFSAFQRRWTRNLCLTVRRGSEWGAKMWWRCVVAAPSRATNSIFWSSLHETGYAEAKWARSACAVRSLLMPFDDVIRPHLHKSLRLRRNMMGVNWHQPTPHLKSHTLVIRGTHHAISSFMCVHHIASACVPASVPDDRAIVCMCVANFILACLVLLFKPASCNSSVSFTLMLYCYCVKQNIYYTIFYSSLIF